jgi:SAM-dependent methyltransferase
MESGRKPFQGVLNIIRFNWHFYAISVAMLGVLLFVRNLLPESYHTFIAIFCLLAFLGVFISLLVSFYIYDISELYHFIWLKDIHLPENAKIININSGFDETSHLLAIKYKDASLNIFDFYNPVNHTEISIKRARKAYPPYPSTQSVSTTHLPLANQSVDAVFAILSAHEIRNEEERILFFRELFRVVTPDGKIVIVEHLQDFANFMAYNIGFLHFHSRKTWLKAFAASGFNLRKEIKITPFISTFILDKNGSIS